MSTAEPKKKSRWLRKRWIALAAVVILLPTGFVARRAFGPLPATIAAERRDLREVIEVTGTVAAARKVTLKAEAAGPVETFIAAENAHVAAGAPVLQIAATRAKLDLEQAKAAAKTAVTQAEAALQDARDALAAEGSRQRQDLIAQQGTWAKATGNLMAAESEWARGKRLLAQGAVTRQSVDTQFSTREVARVDLAVAVESLAKALAATGLDSARHAVTQAGKALANARETARVQAAQAQDVLAKTRVVAPFAGVVTDWLVERGDLVANGTSLATFEDLADLRLVLPVDELDLPKIRMGMPVTIAFDAFPDLDATGKVVRISRSSTAGSEGVEVFPVDVAFINPGERVKPGMNGDVSFVVREKPKALSLPARAILGAGATAAVMRLEGRKPVRVPITTGLSTVEQIEVLSGLNEGDKVIAAPDPLPSASPK